MSDSKEKFTWGRSWDSPVEEYREGWQILKGDPEQLDSLEVVVGGIEDEWQVRAVAAILNAELA